MSVILTEYMATKNIEINIKTESGYDVLYPLTTPQQAGSLPISGGTLTGPLMLNREPQENMEAVNKNYVDNIVNDYILEPDGHINLRENWYYIGKMTNNATINNQSSRYFNLPQEYVNKQIALVISCNIDNDGNYGSNNILRLGPSSGSYLYYNLGEVRPGNNFSVSNRVWIINTKMRIEQMSHQYIMHLDMDDGFSNNNFATVNGPVDSTEYFSLEYGFDISDGIYIRNLYIDIYSR